MITNEQKDMLLSISQRLGGSDTAIEVGNEIDAWMSFVNAGADYARIILADQHDATNFYAGMMIGWKMHELMIEDRGY